MTTDATRPPDWAEPLGLRPHPEGGWYAETYRHGTRATAAALGDDYPGPRALATGILFLLLPDEESAWHRVRSDELWFHHRGSPLALSVGGDGDRPGEPETVLLGSDVPAGQSPQALVPAGHWQTARPVGDEPVLVSCVVSPGFDFADFTLLNRD